MWLSRSDLRYTLRQMSRKPGFVLLAALVLAGGLAVSLITFTLTYSLFYKTLPITNGERIVSLCSYPLGQSCGALRADDFARIRAEVPGVSNVGIFMEAGNLSLEYDGELWQESATFTEWNLFQLSETNAQLGRTLQPGDHAPGAEAVAVISHGLWQQRFGGDPALVGKVAGIDGQPVRIVGIMPEGYAMPDASQLWLPAPATLLAPLDSGTPMPLIRTYGLLEPGASIEQISQVLTQLMARNRAQFPPDPFAEYPNRMTQYVSQADAGHVAHYPAGMSDDLGRLLIPMMLNTPTLLVFLLACINVGTLLLARINERMKDTSIRVALGAPRGRLLVQLCLESTLVTLLGAALAVLLAGIGLELLRVVMEATDEGTLPFWLDFTVDASTLAGVVFYAMLTIALTSAVPGWRIINGNFNAAMRDGTRGALGLRPGRFSRGLVVAALVMVTLLLYMLALLGSTIVPVSEQLTRVPDNLVNGAVMLDPARYSESERQQFVRSLSARIAEQADVDSARVFVDLRRVRVEAEGEVTVPGEFTQANLMAQNGARRGEPESELGAAIGGFQDVRLLEGRGFTDADTANSELVVTLSESLAERLWPGESPLDARLRVVGVDGVSDAWRRVVGVTTDVTSVSFLDSGPERLVLPLAQIDTAGKAFLLSVMSSSAQAKGRVMQYLRDEFAAVQTANQAVVQDPATVVEGIGGAFRIGVRLSLAIGLFVFAIAIAGIYGLTQNNVLMATHEIGMRRALGARDGQIARMFMKRAGRQVLTGFLVAMLLCAPVTFVFFLLAEELNLDVPFSLGVSAIVIALLYLVVMCATYVPVQRILRMEPGEALRYE